MRNKKQKKIEKSKMAARGSKLVDGVWKVVYTKVIWRFEQLLRPSCMRNIDKLQNPKIPNDRQGAKNG